MSDFGVATKTEIIQACQDNLDEIKSILERSLDQSFEIQVEPAADIEFGDWPEEIEKAGLVLSFEVEGRAAVAVLPVATGMVPIWSRKPDPTGKSKLETLALELGMNLLPEAYMPENCQASWLDEVPEGLERAKGETLGSVHLHLQSGDFTGTMYVWLPFENVDAIWDVPGAEPEAEPEATDQSEGKAEAEPTESRREEPDLAAQAAELAAHLPDRHQELENGLRQLPIYTRSLLRVRVPVMVNLASTKTTLSQVLDMGPGTLIQFDKGCDELLRLAVAGYEIAEGEAVKVGDKFGLRISNLLLPPERFQGLKSRKAS